MLGLLLTFALLMNIVGIMEVSVSAHNSDWWIGKNGYNVGNLRFNINQSAIISNNLNSMANVGTYSVVRTNGSVTGTGGWNNISSKVSITDVNSGLTGSNLVQVQGSNLGLSTAGKIRIFNSSGVEMQEPNLGQLSSDWSRAVIMMNNETRIWMSGHTSISVASERIRKVFIHEVGHVLKLRHPDKGNTPTIFPGHTVQSFGTYGNGFYPLAVMNTGWAIDVGGYVATSSRVRNHDMLNLRTAWGN